MPRAPNTSPQAIALFSEMIDGANQWRHGYDLMTEIGIKSGTLYPLLIRLTESGLLESSWRESNSNRRGPRHVYRLTQDGLSFAQNLLAEARIQSDLKPFAGLS